jgi:hypothetical protein
MTFQGIRLKTLGIGGLLALAGACSGSISGGGTAPSNGGGTPTSMGDPGGSGGPGNTGNSGSPGASGSVPVPANSPCDAGSVPVARTWRLTNAQFRNTVQAVFGFTGPTTDALPQDSQPDGFSSQSDRLSVPPLLASKYMAATDEIATGVVSRSADFIKCPVAQLGSGTCLKDFLISVGTRAWRRPLTPVELTKYTALFSTIAGGNTPEVAFKGVVQALLLSPNFLFRTELGNGGSGTIGLTEHELASALSYMLIDGPPDPTLMDLAASGKLHEPATLAAQATRLLAGAPASKSVGSFFRQWLQFEALPELPKDTALFPVYTPEVVGDLVAESQAFIDDALFAPGGDHSVKTLFTATHSFVTSRTAALYGVQASGTTPVKTELPGKERRGLLTSAGFISAASDSGDTNLPARGRIVREQALCAVVAPPPQAFEFDEAKITPDMTNREKFNTHTTNPACAGCHVMFDGIGFAMEQYDAVGRFRTMDKMKTIDSSGELPLPNTTLKFANYVDFIDQVSKLPDTYACVASQYTSYATGRAPSSIPKCESDAIAQAFSKGDYRLEALVSAIVTSPNFATRRN